MMGTVSQEGRRAVVAGRGWPRRQMGSSDGGCILGTGKHFKIQ